jgi:hypothetical protein
MTIGFRALFSLMYFRQASSLSVQSRIISVSKLKVGILKLRLADVLGLDGAPNSSVVSGSP